MRLQRGIPMLEAALTLAATSTPAADATVRVSSGTPSEPPLTLTHQHSGDSIDWVIGGGTVGGITLLGAAAVGSSRRAHKAARHAGVTSQAAPACC